MEGLGISELRDQVGEGPFSLLRLSDFYLLPPPIDMPVPYMVGFLARVGVFVDRIVLLTIT